MFPRTLVQPVHPFVQGEGLNHQVATKKTSVESGKGGPRAASHPSAPAPDLIDDTPLPHSFDMTAAAPLQSTTEILSFEPGLGRQIAE